MPAEKQTRFKPDWSCRDGPDHAWVLPRQLSPIGNWKSAIGNPLSIRQSTIDNRQLDIMNIAYFDCFSGAGGDMIVAALIDAGADAAALKKGLSALKVGGYDLSIEKVTKQGIAATRFHVQLEPNAKQLHRHLRHILDILNSSGLTEGVRDKTSRIFTRLAEAEAAVHGTTVEKVHFHEVGAVDAIIDVVGAVLALEMLRVDRVLCSPIPTGSGTVACDHGVLPIPAPATAQLLRGVPLAACHEVGELTTPTAAAVLTTIASGFGPIPAMTLTGMGYGAGTRDGRTRPNVLRVLLGQSIESGGDIDQIAVLETNLDDATPELIGYCTERLLTEGALDVFTMPIQMKKQRPGVMLTVLCEFGKAAAMEGILFAETTTFGIRRRTVERTKLRRRFEMVATRFGEIRMKIGEREGVVTISPEFEDCRAAAMKHGVALREVIAEANAAWSRR